MGNHQVIIVFLPNHKNITKVLLTLFVVKEEWMESNNLVCSNLIPKYDMIMKIGNKTYILHNIKQSFLMTSDVLKL